MPVHVLYFAGAREAAGTARETLDDVPATVAELRRALAERHPASPASCPAAGSRWTRSSPTTTPPLRDGAEVAIVPPVAGGAPLFRVVDRPLALAEVVDAVAGPGLRRDRDLHRRGPRRDRAAERVLRLEYEAYAPMAERKLAEIGAEVARAHGAEVAIVHRVGVARARARRRWSSPAPRRTARRPSAPARPCIERLKQDVPIWKREVFEDGSEWVGLGP